MMTKEPLNYESYDYGSPKSFDTYDYTGNSKNPPSIRPQLIPATALRPTTELTTTDLNQLKELDPQPIPKNRRFNNRPPHEEKEEQVENEGAAGAIATILAVFAFIIFTYCFVNYYRQRKRQQKKANQKNNEEINKQNELPVENINSDKVSLHPPPKTNPHHTPNYEPPKESLEQATCLEVEIEKKTRLFPRNSSSYHTQAPAHDQDDPPYDDSLAGKKFFDKTQNHQKNLSSKQHHPSTYFQYSFDDQSNSNLIHQLEKKIRGSGNGGGGENYSGRFSRQKTGAQTENLDPYDFIPQITNSARIRYYTYRKQEGKNTNGNSFSQTGHQASNLQDFSKNENNMTCRDMSRSQTLDSILEHGVFEGKGNNLRPAPDMPSPVMRSSQMIAGVDHSDYVPQSSRHFVQHNNETSVKTKPGGKDSALGSKYWDAVNYGDLNPHKQVDYSKSYKHSPKSDAERPRLLLKKSESVSAADMYRNFNKLTRQNSVKNQLNFTGEDHEDLPEMQELTAKFNSMTRPNPSQFSGPIKSLTLDRIPTQIEPSPVKILEKNDQKLDIARVEVENPEIKDEDQTTMADMKNLEIFVSEKPTFDLKGNFLERKENPLGYNCNFDFGLGDIDRDLANFRDSNVEGYWGIEGARFDVCF